ncbi:AAA family ATPase, partial [Candidatus Stoquefichus massiliensis]|uniref:AAA family ATPase n=1 Tax=Candidatus Stoquefichus massiliensis TaxID=1470350 RepID=UPI0005CA5C42
MQSLYISRVKIKNFRNFKKIEVNLGHKEVIIGENNVGKTNFLRALQLILDPSLSDEDRMLDESDFNDTLVNPMENNEEIQIDIFISNYKDNKTILTVLDGATVKNDNGEEELQITYKFFPHIDDNGNKEYEFNIYKANDESRRFEAYERKYLNLKVIKALRDVEGEMKNSRTSPIRKMLDEYSIKKDELKRIADEYEKSSKEILNLDELIDLTNNINKRFSSILGNNNFD